MLPKESLCPLCAEHKKKSSIVMYSINLEEGVYLCSDRMCQYPFGYDDFVFVSINRPVKINGNGMEFIDQRKGNSLLAVSNVVIKKNYNEDMKNFEAAGLSVENMCINTQKEDSKLGPNNVAVTVKIDKDYSEHEEITISGNPSVSKSNLFQGYIHKTPERDSTNCTVLKNENSLTNQVGSQKNHNCESLKIHNLKVHSKACKSVGRPVINRNDSTNIILPPQDSAMASLPRFIISSPVATAEYQRVLKVGISKSKLNKKESRRLRNLKVLSVLSRNKQVLKKNVEKERLSVDEAAKAFTILSKPAKVSPDKIDNSENDINHIPESSHRLTNSAAESYKNYDTSMRAKGSEVTEGSELIDENFLETMWFQNSCNIIDGDLDFKISDEWVQSVLS